MNRIQASCDLLISLLKQNGVCRIVISSGTRAIPFIRAIESDDYFTCYSVIDERNAAFFALGLCQQLNEPVVMTCTSGTAASNYLSGMTEAFYAHSPLIAITADRSMQVLDQLETQKIDQPAIFSAVSKKSVCLPVIKDQNDFWYAKRLLNETFIAMYQHGTGPIHINLHLEGSTDDLTLRYDDENNNIYTPIKFYSQTFPEKWTEPLDEINGYSRILVVIGQNINIDRPTRDAIAHFCHSRKIPVLGDNLSNFRCEEMIFAGRVIKALNVSTFGKLLPDLVISIGNNFQERIKDLLKGHQGKFRHWLVDESGTVRDWSRSLSSLFESTMRFFFERFNSMPVAHTCQKYLDDWKSIESAAIMPEKMPWSNFYVTQQFAQAIPAGSILHLAILNATRQMQFFRLDPSVKVSCNASSFGIDGCLPTLLGQSAAAPGTPAFILLGDLSFFYAMNAMSIRGISPDVRILLINNGGGAEFHIYPKSIDNKNVDLHIAAAHKFTAKGWAESAGFEYLSASDESSLDLAMPGFIGESGPKPRLLEVFTDLHFDGQYCLDVYHHLEKAIAPALDSIKDHNEWKH